MTPWARAPMTEAPQPRALYDGSLELAGVPPRYRPSVDQPRSASGRQPGSGNTARCRSDSPNVALTVWPNCRAIVSLEVKNSRLSCGRLPKYQAGRIRESHVDLAWPGGATRSSLRLRSDP